MNFENWNKIENTGLSHEQISDIIEACRIAHNDFFNIGLACGIRAAFRVLGELGGDRTKYTVEKAFMHSNGCAALAVSIVCCLNPFKDNKIDFDRYMKFDWDMIAYGKEKQVEIKLHDKDFASWEDVFAAADDDIFASVKVLPLKNQ
ncbi:MAG: hypothetical protein IJP33_00510 [Firmicutes bacterium]|nr:hypothetical protein [Bacillota bacterium]